MERCKKTNNNFKEFLDQANFVFLLIVGASAYLLSQNQDADFHYNVSYDFLKDINDTIVNSSLASCRYPVIADCAAQGIA